MAEFVLNNWIVILNILILIFVFMGIVLYIYYDGDEKKINDSGDSFNYGFGVIDKLVYSIIFALIILGCIVQFINLSWEHYVIDYKNCESAISQNIIDLEEIRLVNLNLRIYKTVSQYDMFIFKDNVKEEIISYEYLMLENGDDMIGHNKNT